ncbi:MAG: 2-amino-4-hydroxy-6-hydroxymethyldihydropteridine diphosphokinase [Alphaproteobacteria bacterium]|nr:2-amino-4-hydroxy-6-hydroxymethyldihydropteridine diphosphokinase [Alphaproteobacteria bacterium]
MILIGLGANLPSRYGTPEQTLQACMPEFARLGFPAISASRIYISAPVPVSDQPWYKNAVCRVETSLSPEELIKALHRIEHDFGRVREIRNDPRVIDLDLLAYNDLKQTDALHIPHPRLHERAFVLHPLKEIAPDWVHPVLDKTVGQMIKGLPEGQDIKALDISLIPVEKLSYGS